MKTIKQKMMLALGVSSLAVATAFADDNTSTNQSSGTLTPQQFVSDAANSGLKEIYLSQLALEKSTNADVKDFARHMVKDHRAAGKKLGKIAMAEGLSLPATNTFSVDDPSWNNSQVANPESLKGGQLLTLTNLPYRSDYLAVQSVKSLTGKDFDQAYVNDMISDHAAAVNEFTLASQNLTDENLKKFAEKTLPTLRHHAMMAQELNEKLNSADTTDLPNKLDSSAPKRPYIAPIP